MLAYLFWCFATFVLIIHVSAPDGSSYTLTYKTELHESDSIKTKLKTQNDTFMNLSLRRRVECKKCVPSPDKKPQKHVPIMIQAFNRSTPHPPTFFINVKMSRKVKFNLFMGELKPQPSKNPFPASHRKQSLEWQLKYDVTFIIRMSSTFDQKRKSCRALNRSGNSIFKLWLRLTILRMQCKIALRGRQ